MRYWVIGLLGLVVCGASIVAIDWGMWHLMLTGTCASGGPYVSARPCPPGTGWHIMAVIFGVFGGLIGVGIWAARGRSGERIESRLPLPLAMWSLLFCTLALSALYATLGPAASSDAPKGTAIFLAALFIPMGLFPLLFALRGRATATASFNVSTPKRAEVAQMASALQQVAKARASGSGASASGASGAGASGSSGSASDASASAAADPAAAVIGDPSVDAIAKIEKLGKLRDKGLITEAEFEVQKQRLLREV